MLTYDSTGFRLDGRPLRVLSGAVHYFRSRPEQWADRLAAVRAMGLNTVETYVPWNLHEPAPGRFARVGELGAFLDEARRQGLWTIVRPGPYICAEWDNGGLPGWLTARLGRRVRTGDPEFLAAVGAFFDVLLPQVVERQWGRPDGSVLMVQVENEYGAFGSDAGYLAALARGLRERGVSVPLFTSDGPEDHMLAAGTVPGVLATVNFGSDPERGFAALRRHRPEDPPFCMEFWNGWFDQWGRPHHTRGADDAADSLRRILAAGGSVNLYMAHGGTSFGTSAGANHADPPFNSTDWTHSPYQPTVTSYDYDAPLDERGLPTAKFEAFRQVLAEFAAEHPDEARHLDGRTPELPSPAPVLAAREVLLDEYAALPFGPAVESPVPPLFEELGLEHGLVRYTASVPALSPELPLTVEGLRDRAGLRVDGRHVASLERGVAAEPVAAGGGARISLLVESLGRVNYGPLLGETKGVTGVRHERQYLHGWRAEPLALDPLPAAAWGPGAPAPETLARGTLRLDAAGDAFLAVPEGGHGYLWVNGFLLGRYDARGPQRTLYCPGPLLRPGPNSLVLLELGTAAPARIELRAAPELG
ncbi:MULTISPECIES: beta-galactosidase family protein [Kitasatospora]|uniref:Putative beta-galactosidase n=1 Tax=Kitasatospora setae (strain ATCC 33774 / DSM 43861 / JCM 3304 / KCC A-0304 / NBRC 14216 / KM-6054) TaxID=452652 RepID=E4NFF9_KITSK|nr:MULTISPECIES: beta-galactosidase family protein [Kitasatospora]BAJ30239.1 putative beta-galactosidase [Kitasatospora setae KM-6054]